MTETDTMSLYRDEAVDFVRTVRDGNHVHYRCVNCGTRVWPRDSHVLGDFIDEHESCKPLNS